MQYNLFFKVHLHWKEDIFFQRPCYAKGTSLFTVTCFYLPSRGTKYKYEAEKEHNMSSLKKSSRVKKHQIIMITNKSRKLK